MRSVQGMINIWTEVEAIEQELKETHAESDLQLRSCAHLIQMGHHSSPPNKRFYKTIIRRPLIQMLSLLLLLILLAHFQILQENGLISVANVYNTVASTTGKRCRDENSSRPSAKIRSNTFSGRLFLPVMVT